MSEKPAPAAPVLADAEQALSLHVAAAQEKMRRSVMIGRLQNDPLADVVDAMADAIGVQHELHLANLQRSTSPASIEPIATAAAEGASQQAAKLARAHNWRTLALTGSGLVVGVVVAAFGGYQAGRSSAFGTVSAVQAAAVRDGPDAATFWAQLMTSNDGRNVARNCSGAGARSENGRRVCAVAMWMEPPNDPGPRITPAGK